MSETMLKQDISPTPSHTVVTFVEKNVRPRAPCSCTDPEYTNQITVVYLLRMYSKLCEIQGLQHFVSYATDWFIQDAWYD